MINPKDVGQNLKSYRENGGSISYTTKELLAYLDQKLDNFIEEYRNNREEMVNNIGNNGAYIEGIQGQVRLLWGAFLGLSSALVGIVLAIFK